jgi:hypothetical protein
MTKKYFPTSSHYFPSYINSNAVYVDKTQFIVPMMAHEGNATYFLSRPRRFGKSLLVSTLEQVFLGKKDLFQGLYIYDKIGWEEFPVIRISMDKIGFTTAGLEQALLATVQDIAEKHSISLKWNDPNLCFKELIEKLFEKYQKRIVVLIDEYDKPIIQYIEKEDSEQAETNRNILKSFYGILKDSVNYLRFSFITGVSKFAKVSIFSDLNQFTDLTLDTRYATICGFTETEIKQYCGQGLEDLAAKEGVTVEASIEKIRYWYNGFSWNAIDFVYNPFSTMLLMDSLVFKNYWFESGTPTFLVKLINAQYRYNLKDIKINSSIYSWHDLKDLDFISIMLQTGYLTLKKHIIEDYYIASYPNKEVENSFCEMLLGGYLHKHPAHMSVTVLDIQEALVQHDLEKVISILKGMFNTLPSQFFQEEIEKIDAQGNKKVIRKAVGESFYHAIVYLVFNILAIRMQVEVSSQEGRIDAVVESGDSIYIFEFKKNRKADVAMQQMEDRNYAQHYALSKKKITLVAISFNLQKRGVSDYQIKLLGRNTD